MKSLIKSISHRDWSKDEIAKYVGPYQTTCLAHATSSEIQNKAASGGAVTALLSHALTKEEIDGALVLTAPVINGKVQPQFIIAHSTEELISAQGSKYIAVQFVKDAIPLIRDFSGRLGVVALPCDTRILRKHCSQDAKLNEKVSFIITLFCGHNSEPELTELITQKLGRDDELQSFTYRTGHWRGQIRLTFRDSGVVEKPFSVFSDYQNLYYFSQRKCHHCYDHLGYYSDISAGDIWSPEMKENPIKHTSLIVRSDIGKGLVEGAVDSGSLTANEVNVETICNGQARTLPFHYNVSARVRAGKLLGEKIKDSVNEHVRWNDYLTALIALANERFTRKESGRRWLMVLPRPILRLYLYIFKGLESIPAPSRTEKAAGSGPTTITICGATILGNRGAEAMLVTTAGIIRSRFSDARINILSYMPKDDRALVDHPSFTVLDGRPRTMALTLPFAFLYGLLRKIGIKAPGLLPRTLKKIKASNAILDVSGISFVDGRGLTSFFNALMIFIPRLLGVPVFKLAQAMGPFHTLQNLLVAKTFLNRCEHIFARGDVTGANLQELGIADERWSRASDIAFLYEPEFSLSSENDEKVEELKKELCRIREQGKQIIVLCPSSVVLEKAKKKALDYQGRFVELIAGLDKDRFHFVFVPNATREGKDTLRNNDLPTIDLIAQHIISNLGEETMQRVDLINYDVNTASLRMITELGDVLVTSRFHSMISGLVAGIPMVVISWSQKYNEVLADFGLDEFGIDFADPTQDICQRVLELIQNRESTHKQIVASLPHVRDLAMHQFDYLEKQLRKTDLPDNPQT